jgi:hypothetical protein
MTTSAPLVLVLGAGASKEVNLPLGSELKQKIADALNFKVDDFQRISGGDETVRDCLLSLANIGAASGALNDYYKAARTIHEAMPLAPSIDNFIDSHRTNPKIAEIGKLAIAACILRAEKDSKLFVDPSNSHNKPNFSKLEGTWFNGLFGILFQHCSWDEINDRLSRLAIISFNYDRCAKHFLREALVTYYRVQPNEADAALSKVAIYYPYGSVGSMQFENSGAGLSFGAQPRFNRLIQCAKELKTFTEGTDESASHIAAIRATIKSSKTLVFLGFAFHPLNLKVLYGDGNPIPKYDAGDVFATAKGLSESDVSVIASELRTLGGYTENRVRLRRDLAAADLVNEYSRHLTHAVQTAPSPSPIEK